VNDGITVQNNSSETIYLSNYALEKELTDYR